MAACARRGAMRAAARARAALRGGAGARAAGARRAPARAAATAAPGAAAALDLDLSPGDSLANGAFEVLSVDSVEAYNVTCYELLHTRTGARWLHCAADDDNNVFNVAFRTTPTDSTGVAHILEHTALCGSERYPVRDPFFNMLKRSLSTFMNAMTAADYTMYPFSSQNTDDFYNLLGVYLDAAFFPKLSRSDFLQEGHRFEFKDPEDPDSGLMIKGVVFNEMKGAMGSQAARFGRALGANLFPESTYHHNSGGDPVNIPELTHDDLVAFHRTHYHPSNGRFFTYGNMPLEATLLKADELALSKFDRLDVSGLDVTDEVRYTEPKRVEVSVPADALVADKDKQSVVGVSWLQINQIAEADGLESFALGVASDLLLSGPQAAFYAPLLEAGLGSGFSPGTGYGGTRRETSFSVGLKGVATADVGKVEEIVMETLEKVAEEGLPRERVDATLHQLELSTARVTPQFGLGAAFGVMSTWVHGGDALRPLRVSEYAARLEAALDADPAYWSKLIRKHFLDNPHRVTVVAHADEDYDAKLEAAEAERVAAIEAALTDEEKTTIVAEAKALKAAQEAPSDVNCLPTLDASTIPRLAQTYPSQHAECAGAPLQIDVQPTNGLTFVHAIFDLSELPERLVPYVDLFAGWLDELGTATMGPGELSEAIKGSTGGISADVMVTADVKDPMKSEVALSISSHALDRNVGRMFELMSDVATGARWTGEEARMRTLTTRLAAAAGASLSQQGLSYAQLITKAPHSPGAALEDRMDGLESVVELQRIVREDAIDETAQKLAEIAAFVFGGGAKVLRSRISAEEGAVDAAREGLEAFLNGVSAGGSAAAAGDEPTVASAMAAFEAGSARTFLAVPTQTNYAAATLPTVPYVHEDAPALYMLAQALSTCYLHREIREKGGAYGGGCSASPLSGNFSFTSYRDPNQLATLDVFKASGEWAATSGSISDSDMNEATLRAFKALDSPLAPQNRGTALFLSGLDDESRQRFRDGLFACTKDTLRAAAEKYLVGREASVAIVGNAAAVPVANGQDGWTVLGADGKPFEA